MTANKSFVFSFSDVEVREREYCIVKSGEVLAVEPKAFRVLLHLVHNPQRLISKEELLDSVWGDASVTENSLTQNIAKLRRLLNDDVRNPRYIETVATVGYRFLCNVEISEEASGNAGFSESRNGMSEWKGTEEPAPLAAKWTIEGMAERGGAKKTRWRWLLAGTIFAAGLVSFAWYLRRPQAGMRVSEFAPITHDGHHKALFGTDGIRLYLDQYPGSQPLTQMAESGGEVQRIALPLPDTWAFDVSPDGSAFLVGTGDGAGGKLWSIGTLGRPLRRLADGGIESAAWSPDGKQAVYSTPNGDLDVVRSDGSGAQRLTAVPYHTGSALFEQISWSPDGGKIRFDRNNKIFEVSADGSGLHPFMPGWRPGSWQCCGRWTFDGEFFVFLSWDGRTSPYASFPHSQIWALDERRGWFRKRSTDPVQLTSGPIRWGRPVPSRDGKKIFARGVILNGELERLDGQSHQLQPYLGGISAESVCFSSDGRFVAYVTFPEGILWRANRDGSNPVQLTDPPTYPTFPQWSPDGSKIVFVSEDEGGDLKNYVISSEGGAPRPLIPEQKGQQGNLNWSPDGSKIAFESSESAGGTWRQDIRILDLASREITTLPGSDGVGSPRWSPNGRFIAGLAPNTSELTIFDLETQRWSTLHQGQADFPAWSQDGRFIYFLRIAGESAVFRIRSSGGKAERLADLKGVRQTGVYLNWMGLDPEDTPLLLRDAGGDDIYALALEQK